MKTGIHHNGKAVAKNVSHECFIRPRREFPFIERDGKSGAAVAIAPPGKI
ncbi:MAG: hypothetical protein IPL01_04040 [Acidobacteria bacterium]|nr:hypothetical protein [Acidobacteriota bacterium]